MVQVRERGWRRRGGGGGGRVRVACRVGPTNRSRGSKIQGTKGMNQYRSR
jgi:hypothetical protein